MFLVIQGTVSDFDHVHIFGKTCYCHCGTQIGTALADQVFITLFTILRRDPYQLLSSCVGPITDSDGQLIPHRHLAHMTVIYRDLMDPILPIEVISIRGGIRQREPYPHLHSYAADPILNALSRRDVSEDVKTNETQSSKKKENVIDLTSDSTPEKLGKSQSPKSGDVTNTGETVNVNVPARPLRKRLTLREADGKFCTNESFRRLLLWGPPKKRYSKKPSPQNTSPPEILKL